MNCNKSEYKSYNGPILDFKTSKSNERKITALFKDDDENEVKEYINSLSAESVLAGENS
jgi:hypothetical protein